jgi:hypothetical protein
MSSPETVAIPLDVARWIYAAFLPLNPRKMRNADPRLVEAAQQFKEAVEAHGDPRAALNAGRAALEQGCVNHPDRPVRTNLDGEDLCQDCADAWVRGEGLAALEQGS